VSIGEKGITRVIERAKWKGVGECERVGQEERAEGEKELEPVAKMKKGQKGCGVRGRKKGRKERRGRQITGEKREGKRQRGKDRKERKEREIEEKFDFDLSRFSVNEII
jgi:hypothetical protein